MIDVSKTSVSTFKELTLGEDRDNKHKKKKIQMLISAVETMRQYA